MVTHLQVTCFGQKSILNWTLEDDGSDPPHYPNAYKNPFAQTHVHDSAGAGRRSRPRPAQSAAQTVVHDRNVR